MTKVKIVKLKQLFEEVLKNSQEYIDLKYSDYILLEDAILDTYSPLREADTSEELEKYEIEREEVIQKIIKGDFDTDPVLFKESLDRACNTKHGEYLVSRSLKGLKSMKTFKIKDLDIGFALKDFGSESYSEIVALHNNSKYARLGNHLLYAAIKAGGKYLSCFGEHLKEKLYVTNGFEVYESKEDYQLRNGKIETLYFMKLKRLIR